MNINEQDLEDALDHVSDMVSRDKPLALKDFFVGKPKLISISSLSKYDDISGWVELDPDDLEDPDDKDELFSILTKFRGRNWAERAIKWEKPEDIPPIVIVVTKDRFSEIGDGRGRINYAILRKFKNIPAIIIRERIPLEEIKKKLASKIRESRRSF